VFHALLFGVIPAAAIIGLALYGAVSGRPTFWDSWIKKTAARMHTFGLIGAGVLAAGLWGISAVTAAWPVFAGAWLSRKLSEIGLDALAKVGLLPASPMTRAPRIIHHADGNRAVVDGRVVGYQRLPEPHSALSTQHSALTRWLNEKV
jgi:hypothetical protein